MILYISSCNFDIYAVLAMNGTMGILFWIELFKLNQRVNNIGQVYIVSLIVFVAVVLLAKIRITITNNLVYKIYNLRIVKQLTRKHDKL